MSDIVAIGFGIDDAREGPRWLTLKHMPNGSCVL